MKKGFVHGATDELGYHALGEGHYVTDLHATVLKAVGLDPAKENVSPVGRPIALSQGKPIEALLT